jgi:N-acetylneuraminate synthase
MNKPKIIAEIGCNHKGSMDVAKEMIKMVKIFCNADAVKFQKRNPKELLTPEQYNAPHPNPVHAYGETYGRHREYLEFTLDQHIELQQYCHELDITYASSVWDITSAKEVASLNPPFIKVPSAANTNTALIRWLCENFHGELHISTGMTTRDEADALVNLFVQYRRNHDLVLYNCISGYPVPFEDLCLLEISAMKEKYSHKIKSLGFSGHHLGIAVDVAAYVLGAEYIERHFTLDRTWKGTDHAASLEPDGLRRLVRDLNAVHSALKYKHTDILEIEKAQREKLKHRPSNQTIIGS